MSRGMEIEKKFNNLEAEVINYIRYLQEVIASKDAVINKLTFRLKNTQEELEQFKFERAKDLLFESILEEVSRAHSK